LVGQLCTLCASILGTHPRWVIVGGFKRTKKELDSYFTSGWITVSAWVFVSAAGPAILANTVSALVIFNYPNYDPANWHTTMIMWAFIIIPLVLNIFFRKVLNTFETLGGILHIVFFIVSIIIQVTLARRSTTDFVFKTIVTDVSGWTNPGVTFGIGLLTVVYPVAGEI
jgi:choline transport protein